MRTDVLNREVLHKYTYFAKICTITQVPHDRVGDIPNSKGNEFEVLNTMYGECCLASLPKVCNYELPK